MDLAITFLDIVELNETKNTNNIKNTAEKKIYISSKEIKELNKNILLILEICFESKLVF